VCQRYGGLCQTLRYKMRMIKTMKLQYQIQSVTYRTFFVTLVRNCHRVTYSSVQIVQPIVRIIESRRNNHKNKVFSTVCSIPEIKEIVALINAALTAALSVNEVFSVLFPLVAAEFDCRSLQCIEE